MWLDTNREAESGASHIRSSLEQNLTNIDLLPVFNKAITDRQVLRFSYQPFGQEQIEPNRELRGRILMYGESLEVMEPLTLREQIKEVIMKQMNQYADKK